MHEHAVVRALHPYLEVVYGPILGPTAVLVARNLGRRLAAATGPITVSVVAIALELGLRPSHDEPLGKHSHVHHAIDRLEHTRLVRWLAHHHLVVQTEVPRPRSTHWFAYPSPPPKPTIGYWLDCGLVDLRVGHDV